jgi:hypothetical protein
MDGLHWPGYGLGFDFSVVEVVLGIPALFEDILMIPVVLANLAETRSRLIEASLRSIRRSEYKEGCGDPIEKRHSLEE